MHPCLPTPLTHPPDPCIPASHAHSRWETHVKSVLLWGAGQVNRCQETPPGPAGSPGSQNDPPHSPSLLQDQPARTCCPPAQCPGLLGRRQSPWRRLAHPDLAKATALHPCPPAPFPVPSTVHPLGSCISPPTLHPPQSMVEKALLSGITTRGLTHLPNCLVQVLLSRPQFSPLENGKEIEQKFVGPSLDVRFSQRPGEGR